MNDGEDGAGQAWVRFRQVAMGVLALMALAALYAVGTSVAYYSQISV